MDIKNKTKARQTGKNTEHMATNLRLRGEKYGATGNAVKFGAKNIISKNWKSKK